MATYYETLRVSPTASAAEIETVIETQYDQWRRLVTHHDANVVNQANLAISTLETIRATLTDPSRRSAYDAGIGLSGIVGGLADLDIILQSLGPAMTPPAPGSLKATGVPSAATVSSSLWTCPNPECRADNPPHTRYCFKCGTELVRECPECGGMTSLVATQMCGACGYSHEVAAQRRGLRVCMTPLEQECQRLQAAVDTPPKIATKQQLIMIAPALPGIIGVTSEGLDRVFGWIWLVTYLIGLVWWMRRWKARLDSEKQASRQVLEARTRELDSLKQEYGRLALLRTKA